MVMFARLVRRSVHPDSDRMSSLTGLFQCFNTWIQFMGASINANAGLNQNNQSETTHTKALSAWFHGVVPM